MAQIHSTIQASTGVPDLVCITHISPVCGMEAHLDTATGIAHSTIHFSTAHHITAMGLDTTPDIMVVMVTVDIMAAPTTINMYTTVTTEATITTGHEQPLAAQQEQPTGEICRQKLLLSVLKLVPHVMQQV